MKKKKYDEEQISLNANDRWGGVDVSGCHDAAIGARMCDNWERDFSAFDNRTTIVCKDMDVESELHKWLFGPKGKSVIRKNTKFAFSADDANAFITREIVGKDRDIEVELHVRCAGEYCHVAAYADRIPRGKIFVDGMFFDGHGGYYTMGILGRPGCFPKIRGATSMKEAMDAALDYIANELDGKDDIVV